jgi:quercetin dioxygenase-like cupin family protein
MPEYDPALDPLKVGAKFSKIIGDTLNIKMYEFALKPGDSAALHSHPDHASYMLQGGKAAITLQGKDRQVVDVKAGTGFYNRPVSDAAKNIGTTTLKLLIIEIYRPRGK